MRRSVWTWAVAAAVAALVVVAGGAAATRDDDTLSIPRFAKIDPTLLESSGPHGTFVPASLSNRLVTVMLQFNGDPVAVQDASAKENGQKLTPDQKAAIRAQLKSQQDAAKGGIASAGAQIIGQLQDAYNGVQVVVPQRNVAQLATLPGVNAVVAVQSYSFANIHGVPFVGAPQAWGSFGVTGAGVKVAVIDTGVDYTHADFGGSGNPADFSAAAATSTLPANSAWFGPTAPKVKGGFDFVGDSYNANPNSPSYQPVPHPDPNPLDCNGHGTHTSGTATGFGVLSDGSTFHGPYDASTVSSHSWNVGPGVAPGADLYAYRVFGCQGSSDVVALAINRAVADGVNVISMSLGAPLGGTNDPTSVASQNAVNDGVAVIAAGGNNGSGAYVVSSPGTASGVLSVAALDGSVPTYPGGHFALSTGKSLDAINANAATFSDGLTLPVVVVHDPTQPGGVSLGCSVAAFQAANVTGKLAVVQRGVCARVAKAIYGRDAGAAAVAMINNSAGYPPFEGDITFNPDTGQQVPKVTIPFFGIKGTVTGTDGMNLIAADGGSVVLTNTTVPNSGYKVVASFSSGGPRNPDSAPKPEVIAPGVSVASAGIGTGTGAIVESGTSMATPMTAGIAALVKQAHPSWIGAQIKAAIMNTANPALNSGYNVRRAGTGVVQAQLAVNSSVLATTGDGLDSIAFGYVPGSGDYSASKTFTLTNTGGSAATYNLSVATNGGQSGASVGVTPSSVTIPAGTSTTVQATLSISSAAFAALPSDDTFSIGPGGVLTVRGDILATPASGSPSSDQTLRLPYIVVPRGLSNVTAGTPGPFTQATPPAPGQNPPALPPGQTLTSTLPLSNSGIHSGTADLYAWGITDPQETGGPNDVRDVGVQSLSIPQSTDRELVFLVNTWGRAANQTANEYDVLVDTNGDGVPDFVVVGADLGAVTAGSFNGVMASFTFNASTGALVDAFFADAPMNGSTIELPTLASDLGIAGNGNGSTKTNAFTYTVNAFDLVSGGVDTTGSATFDPFKPPVSSGDFATLAPGGAASFTLAVDQAQQTKEQALGWLVASVDDANGAAQAEEVQAP
jgi:minor extracellular serine protease Vpr